MTIDADEDNNKTTKSGRRPKRLIARVMFDRSSTKRQQQQSYRQYRDDYHADHD